MKAVKFLPFIIFLCSTHCGGEAGTRVGNPPSEKSFPVNFAIASPTATAEGLSAAMSAVPSTLRRLYATKAFSSLTDEINAILNGESITKCSFDPTDLLASTDDDTCYGPKVVYTDHPDGKIPNSGELPPGDVGLATEKSGDTDEACSAAQFNQLNLAVSVKTTGALKGLASMICTANNNDIDLPETGETIDLKDEMNAMASSNNINATFSVATLSKNKHATSGRDDYSYLLTFSYQDSGEDNTASLKLNHLPLDDDNKTYKGNFSYQTTMDLDEGQCQGKGLDAGSILYDVDSEAISFRVDTGKFCDSEGKPLATGALDPDDTFNTATNPDGWVMNYTIFSARFEGGSLAGSYTSAWQAGTDDTHARVFNLHLTSDGTQSGDAFFGYGPTVNDLSFAGQIKGFICNWTGPGNDHTLKAYVQHQAIVEDSSSGLFTATSSKISYAPTNSCTYDGKGSFTYDSDGNGTRDTNAATAVANDLEPASDADGNGFLDVIEDTGFSLPIAIETL